MPAGEKGFSPQAHAASLKVRKRNARLRKQGKLPPIKRKGADIAATEALPLDHPMFDKAPPAPAKKYKSTKGNAEALELLRVVIQLGRKAGLL